MFHARTDFAALSPLFVDLSDLSAYLLALFLANEQQESRATAQILDVFKLMDQRRVIPSVTLLYWLVRPT